MPSASLLLVVGAAVPTSASPVRASPVTGFRTPAPAPISAPLRAPLPSPPVAAHPPHFLPNKAACRPRLQHITSLPSPQSPAAAPSRSAPRIGLPRIRLHLMLLRYPQLPPAPLHHALPVDWRTLSHFPPTRAAGSALFLLPVSLLATSPRCTAPAFGAFAAHKLRLAPLAVGAAVPHRRRRCGNLRPPTAPHPRLLRCPHVAGATARRPTFFSRVCSFRLPSVTMPASCPPFGTDPPPRPWDFSCRRGPASSLPCATRRLLLGLCAPSFGPVRPGPPSPSLPVTPHVHVHAGFTAPRRVLTTPMVSSTLLSVMTMMVRLRRSSPHRLAQSPAPRLVRHRSSHPSSTEPPLPVTLPCRARCAVPPLQPGISRAFWSLTLPPRFVRDKPSATLTSPPAASPHSCRTLAAPSSARPSSRHRCGLRPSPASAPRRPRCPHSLRTPLPRFRQRASHACPSAPSAVTSTQSPWRLPSAGFAGVDSPSLIPQVLSFLTACRGFGFHTPRIPDAGGAIRTLGPRLSAQPPPSAAAVLLDQAYVAPIHAGHHTPNRAGLRLSYTDTRAVHACRCRKHGPIHDRHTPIIIASTPVTAIVSSPCTPAYRSLRRHPGPGIPERTPYWACPSDSQRAHPGLPQPEIATPPPIW